jgi:hypothetical protein
MRAANKLVLNIEKTNIMKFITNNSSHSTLCLGYREKYVEEMVYTKFLGLQINNHIIWNNHIEQTIPKLSGACYAVRLVVHISNINPFKSIYYAYLHSILKSGIIFWSNSSNSGKIFILQKKIVRIMAGTQARILCRCLFTLLEISPVPCQYILSLMNFTVNNQDNLKKNSSIHRINTRNEHHLHRPNATLPSFQKVHFMLVSQFSTL